MIQYTILYAEDEEQTRMNYTNYLKRYFKEVYSVTNGQEALDMYKKQAPDILLLDINMPKIDGLNLAKQIRQKDKITRIIILTAHLEQDKLLFAAELNLTKYLPKPIFRDELKLALNEAIRQFQELKNEVIYLDDEFYWNTNTKKLYYKKENIKLTKHEILLLELLCTKNNIVFTIDEISYFLWNEFQENSASKVKDIIKRIRKKLPKNTIENIYGAGYKLTHL